MYLIISFKNAFIYVFVSIQNDARIAKVSACMNVYI